MIIAWSRSARHGVMRFGCCQLWCRCSYASEDKVCVINAHHLVVMYSHCSLLLIGFTCFCGSHSAAAMISAICSAVMSLSTQGSVISLPIFSL